MRIAICDESAASREALLQLVRKRLSGEPFSYQVKEYVRATDLLYDVQDGEHVDMVFADMATPDGWESVASLRCVGFEGFVILMSSCGAHAVDGYALGADGYLLKPFEKQAVDVLFDRLCGHLRKACLTVRSHRRLTRIPYSEILYIESRNAKCLVHRVNGEIYTMYTQLDELQTQLADVRFLRCHQSYLVNMDHVVLADKQFEMSNGDIVSIRQRELRVIRDRYRGYVCSADGGL